MTLDRDRRALTLFLLLAFTLSWSGWIFMQWLAATHQTPPWFPLLFYSGLVVAPAALLAAAFAGSGELGRLLRQLTRLDAGFPAWALAAVIPLVWVGGSILVYVASHGGSLGPVDLGGYWKVMTRPSGLVNFSFPLCEEIAWRGLLLPLLMKRRGAFASSLIVGAIWAGWHAPFYWTRILEDPAWFANFCFGVMCLSVIFAGVYLIGRSLLPCILLHWHINAIQDAIGPTFPSLPDLGHVDAFGLSFSAVIFAIAVVFAIGLIRYDRRRAVASTG